MSMHDQVIMHARTHAHAHATHDTSLTLAIYLLALSLSLSLSRSLSPHTLRTQEAELGGRKPPQWRPLPQLLLLICAMEMYGGWGVRVSERGKEGRERGMAERGLVENAKGRERGTERENESKQASE
jgi:hypothetical protein